MSSSSCPLCHSELINVEVNPCMDCGANPNSSKGKYVEYEVLFGLKLTLCEFCSVDFGSYDPMYFGLDKNEKIGFEYFNFVKEVSNTVKLKDKYCTECEHRLAFLKFIEKCRIEKL